MAGGNSQTSFDILLRFVTEMVGEDVAKKSTENMASLKKQVEDSNQSLKKQTDLLKKWKDELASLQGKLRIVGEYSTETKALKDQIALSSEGIRYQTTVVNESREAHKKLVSQLAAEEQQQKGNQQAALRTASVMTRAASVINGISNTLVISSSAMLGTLFKAAKDFADNADNQTALTANWKKETDSIAESYQKIGQVAASEILPFLTKAASIAEKIASFAEQNPGVIGTAVQVGLIGLAIGTIGKAVASGIKLVADATYIATTASQVLAASEMLAASGGMGVAATTFATTVGVVLLPALVIFAAIMSGVLVGLMAYEAIAKNSGGKLPDLETLGTQTVTIVKNLFDQFTAGTEKAAEAVSKFGENTDKLLEAFSKMREAERAENAKYVAEKSKINQKADADLLKAASNTASKIKEINDRAATDRANIITNFAKTSHEDEMKYEADRAAIIRDGGVEIARIEQDRLEKLRQLEMDHSDRVDELAANRDALGLVLEQRKYDRNKAEIDRQAGIEIAQRRQDMAIRLQDLAQNFAMERAQKQAQFAQDLQENAAKREEDIKQERAAYAQRAKEISANRIAELKQLDQKHREEQTRIRNAFLAEVRDLDASLLNEQNRKRQAYSAMLSDLDQFLSAERAKRSTGNVGGGTIPGFATGGYTPDGIIRSHANEFIANRATSRSLEQMIGGKLTQQNLVAAVAGGTSLTVNTRNRFDGTYTKSMKRQVERDTLESIRAAFRRK